MKKFLKYTAIEFAEDASFADWILHNNEQAGIFWDQFLLENPGKKEEIEQAKSILHTIQIQEKSIPQSKLDAVWNQIESKTKNPADSNIKQLDTSKSKRRFLLPAIAASLLLLSLAWWNFSDSNLNVQSQYAESKTELLPDGSTVILNAGSSLKYNPDKFIEDRSLSLEGEAYFSVQKGSSFKVRTKNGTVEVLGTSFNVNDRHGLKVDCYSGKVRVSNINDKAIILTKRMGVHFISSSEPLIAYTFSEAEPKWKEGLFEFKEVPLVQVFEELERQFNVSVVDKNNFVNKPYTGFFTNTNLDSALHSICWPMRLKNEINGQQIKIIVE